jgi:hypothetical protein
MGNQLGRSTIWHSYDTMLPPHQREFHDIDAQGLVGRLG